MIPNGIYIKSSMDYIAGELQGNLRGLKRSANDDSPSPECSGSMRCVVLFLDDIGDGWCRIQATGDPEGITLVAQFLTGHKSLENVLVWDCDYESIEYNYSFLKQGKLLEQFSVRGTALEEVSFVSELRHVQPRDMIRGQDFAEEAFERLCVGRERANQEGAGRIMFEFNLPPKPSVWKSLLGTLAGGE